MCVCSLVIFHHQIHADNCYNPATEVSCTIRVNAGPLSPLCEPMIADDHGVLVIRASRHSGENCFQVVNYLTLELSTRHWQSTVANVQPGMLRTVARCPEPIAVSPTYPSASALRRSFLRRWRLALRVSGCLAGNARYVRTRPLSRAVRCAAQI